MTEQEWHSAEDPVVMLTFLSEQHRVNRTNLGKRRLRLFACACLRRQGHLIKEPLIQEVIALSERRADWQVLPLDLLPMQSRVTKWLQQHQGLSIEHCFAAGAFYLCRPGMSGMWPQFVAHQMAYARGLVTTNPLELGWDQERFQHVHRAEMRAQAEVLRDIFGNPWHPLPRRKFSGDLRSLAQACYEGDASLYGILADALSDAGEEAAAAHCRQGGHARGCHVVDWVRS
jgi:hypothetical protein